MLALALVALGASAAMVAAQVDCVGPSALENDCNSLADNPPGGFQAAIASACSLQLMAPCGGQYFCPNEFVTREDMAVHLEKLLRGSAFTPSQPPTAPFADVPATYCLAGWVAQLVCDHVTAGCGGGNYCPFAAVTRWDMAVFLSKVISCRLNQELIPVSGTVPNMGPYNCVSGGQSVFSDVPPTDGGCKFIHYIAAKGVTAGCYFNPATGERRYCPTGVVSRAQMAVFLVVSSTHGSTRTGVCCFQ